MQKVHLDAEIVLPYFCDRGIDGTIGDISREEVKRSRNTIGNLKGAVSRDCVRVKISHTALGEIISKVIEYKQKDPEAQEIRLWKEIERLKKNLSLDIVPLYKEATIIAHELSEKDRAISGNDAYIAGLALDDECTHLITADSTLLTSPAIRQLCNERNIETPKIETKY